MVVKAGQKIAPIVHRHYYGASMPLGVHRYVQCRRKSQKPYWELGEIYKSSFMSMDDFVPLNIETFDFFFECHLLKKCRFILYLFMGFLLHLSVALTIKIKLRKWCLHFLFPGFVNSPLYLPLHRLTEFNPALLLLGDCFSSYVTKGDTIGSYDKREVIVSDAIE